MILELTRSRLEEIICCIVDNGLNRDEACDYALEVIFDDMGIEETEGD